MSTHARTSADQSSLTRPGGRSLRHFFRELFHSISDDDIFGRSAQLSYYFFFAIFPGFLFLSSLPGLLTGPGSGLRANLMQHLGSVIPPQAFSLVAQTFNSASHNAGKMTFGALTALYSATAGMSAACDTLNAVHDVREGRPWWKVQVTALLLTLATALLLLCACAVFLFGDMMIGAVSNTAAHGLVWWLIKIAQWIVAFLFVTLIFGITYYWAPDIKDREWHWITPGAMIGIVIWILATVALRIYLNHSNSYSATYGTVGAVMVLLLWFYIAGFALLTGAEINAVVEDTAAHQGDPEATAKGQKAPRAA